MECSLKKAQGYKTLLRYTILGHRDATVLTADARAAGNSSKSDRRWCQPHCSHSPTVVASSPLFHAPWVWALASNFF